MNYIEKYILTDEKEGFYKALALVEGRQKGDIKSLITPWQNFNDAGVDGLEWHTTNIIAARPGGLKSTLKDELIEGAYLLNPAPNDFNVIKFEFEMFAQVSVIREFAKMLGKSTKYVMSAMSVGTIKNEEIERCKIYTEKRLKYPIQLVNNPCTVDEFVSIITKELEKSKNIGYRKTLITIDQATLFLKASHEKDIRDTLKNLGAACTYLKKRYPLIFIILTQLNRACDNPDRCEPGKASNFLSTSDIYESDHLLMDADILIGITRPADINRRIPIYGADKFIIKDDKVVVMHFLKTRSGDTRTSFFEFIPNGMKIVETAPPARLESKKIW